MAAQQAMELEEGTTVCEKITVYASARHERVYLLDGYERIEWCCHVLEDYDMILSSKISCNGLGSEGARSREVTERERAGEFSGYLDLGVDHAGWLEGLGATPVPSPSDRPASSRAVLTLEFDNTYSWFTAKALELRLTKIGGAAPKTSSFIRTIAACETDRQWERALRLLHRMRDVRLAPEAQNYSAAMSVCKAAGRWQEVLSLLSEMQTTKSPAPDAGCYNLAISACEKAGRAQQALQLTEEMAAASLAKGPPPPPGVQENIDVIARALREALGQCPSAAQQLRAHLVAAKGSLESYAASVGLAVASSPMGG